MYRLTRLPEAVWYLITPASSVPSERIFSRTGAVVAKKNAANVANLIFGAENLQLSTKRITHSLGHFVV